ncbi:related to Putative nitronate monooxygenase [Saccharomycodes ludwigii]|uniref:Related to Putative nitronate monooxygenase n=1 Tax=Saccharomycodes ludwigii TaxID=36035 RepID=A0A376B3N7_9ASCO|nr:hypothetical protein SCDLUD_004962 [Saccharomycodes ludwigii]KAH3899516.1 hypothetical protein SCDLUD_004962 [Saccharomycodes ludwigii]SSD59232.1 related to Putative nitronate monooxygenase [Saccharomycodes ludwigii]
MLLNYKHFLSKIGVKYPIIQAPMAGVSTPKMAANVAMHGGIGSLPVSGINFTQEEAISKLETLLNTCQTVYASNNLNINFFCHKKVSKPTTAEIENWLQLYSKIPGIGNNNLLSTQINFMDDINVSFMELESSPQKLEKLMTFLKNKYTPKFVSFHFGAPGKSTIKKFQDIGILVLVTATSLQEAIELISLNVDGIICQGYEAGGHRGNFDPSVLDENLPTYILFDQIKKYLNTINEPKFLIAAGGIISSKDARYYIDNGASAVQMGTAFLFTSDCTVNYDNCKYTTVMTPLVSGKPARAMLTPFIENLLLNYEHEKLPPYSYMYAAFKQLRALYPDKINFNLVGSNYKNCLQWIGKSSGDLIEIVGKNVI